MRDKCLLLHKETGVRRVSSLSSRSAGVLPEVTLLRIAPMRHALPVAFLVLLVLPIPLDAADPQVPKGFTALFNGKDLTGWHGMPHFDPYKLAAMKPDER